MLLSIFIFTALVILTGCQVQRANSIAGFDLEKTVTDEFGIVTRPSMQFQLLERMAALDTTGQTRLAMHYYAGIGTKRNPQRAARLFTKAAESNNTKAQVFLAVLYLNGEGVGRDPVEASKWFLVAKNSKLNRHQSLEEQHYSEIAKVFAEELSKTMSAQEQSRANQLASRWLNTSTAN